ncbi:NosD domain-containing protein [Streptosporangium saharense]|uniref:Parallel beta-helix repeat protein n=1 Tax=Streptosporangium saharense TaxID=1706840 RepID=A0A7W7QL34_9ACTN|nr:right-handed parallel beta-helix repeat-containing protein [Streptosporangium saharense]MBB4915488.1 parallel beta-helix repeat protein [Streptosporangium saharense]
MSNRKNGLGAARLSGTFRAGFAVLSGALTVALTAAGLGAASPASAATARAATVAAQCGDVVTANLVLTADLVCTGTGLTIGADNVTVNLAGHTVSGAPAVSVPDRRDTKVVNGTLTGSQAVVSAGSQLTSPIPLTISRVRLRAETRLTNTTAVIGQASGGCVVNGLRAQDSWVTIDRCEVRESLYLRQSTGTVRASKLTSGALRLEQSSRGRYENNVFDDFTVLLYDMSRENVFIGNVLKNAESAFYTAMPQSPNVTNTIQDNDIRNNDIGFEAKDVTGFTIKGNRFTGNRTVGILVDNDLKRTVGEWISDNLFTGNGKQPSGINDRDGNPVRGGVHVRTISDTRINLARNTGRLNGGHLIWAPAGQVVDGGGNRGPCGPVPNPDLTCS